MRVGYILALAVGCIVACNICSAASNPADINNDNKVGWLDMKMIAEDWLSAAPTPADVDNSGDVQFVDFAILANNWQWRGPLDDLVLIDAGDFLMGDHFYDGWLDELPVHAVYLDSFYIARYPITNQQYCDYLNWALSQGAIEVRNAVVYAAPAGTDPYCDTNSHDPASQIQYSAGIFAPRTKEGRDMSEDPMVQVSWYGAAAYCNWRSAQQGKEACYNLSTWECDFAKNGYRLPTEAQWEYAARGGHHLPYYRFPWGDTISHRRADYYSYSGDPYDESPTGGYHPAYNDGTFPYTAPVGSFQANDYGLYDMAGNLWQWCNDWYASDYYASSPYDNPTGPSAGTCRVARGGCWFLSGYYSRVAARDYYYGYPEYRCQFYGFRVVLDAE